MNRRPDMKTDCCTFVVVCLSLVLSATPLVAQENNTVGQTAITNGVVPPDSQPTQLKLQVPSIPSGPMLAASATSHCQAIASADAKMALLAKVCEFSLTYLHELPDFVCQQTTTEGRGRDKTTVNAQITFRSGTETLSNISVNGEPPKPKVNEIGRAS